MEVWLSFWELELKRALMVELKKMRMKKEGGGECY